jgi:hypothetical protein
MQRSITAVIFLTLVLLATSFASAQQSTHTVQARSGPMNNADVVSLVFAGLGDVLISEKIRSASETDFDVTVDGMKMLKSQGVSDQVIHAMLESSTSPAGYSTSDDPTLRHQPGIYAQVAGKDGQAHLILLEHTGTSGEKAHKGAMSGVGTAASYLPMVGGAFMIPHGKTHIRASLTNPRSPVQLDDKNPNFYIYVTEDNQRFGGSNFSARDFELLKFRTTSKTREVQISTVSTGSFGMEGAGNTGIDDKVRQPTSVQKVKPGIYLIKLMKPLKPGEYAFEHQLDGEFYDFGITEGH